MPRSFNQVILMGHLGQDAEVKHTAGGQAVANFTLATDNRYQNKQSGEWVTATDWHRIVYWGADKIGQYLTKGKAVHVTGRLQTRSYEDNTGTKRYVTEVVARDVILLGGRDQPQHEEAAPAVAPAEEDVPF